MGTYVHYSLGDADGITSSFLEDLGVFMAWIAPLAAEYPDDFPPGLHHKMLDFMQRGDAAFTTASREEARLIDSIVDEYYWNFCHEGNRHPALDITPSMHKWCRYAAELADVLPTASAMAGNIYRSLFRGRTLARCDGHAYESEDGVFHLSWLLPAEVATFLSELEPFETGLDDLEDHQAGVLWVILALQEAKRKGSSLIVSIA